jgi:hypothetical protein
MSGGRAIEGQIVLLASAKASVTLARLSELVERVERHLRECRESYDQSFERIDGVDETRYYLTEPEHWDRIGSDLGFDAREIDAVRRSHEAQFQRDGRRLDRIEEFESALEIRTVVAIGAPASRPSR